MKVRRWVAEIYMIVVAFRDNARHARHGHALSAFSSNGDHRQLTLNSSNTHGSSEERSKSACVSTGAARSCRWWNRELRVAQGIGHKDRKEHRTRFFHSALFRLWLTISQIPENAKLQKDVVNALVKGSTVFINYLGESFHVLSLFRVEV